VVSNGYHFLMACPIDIGISSCESFYIVAFFRPHAKGSKSKATQLRNECPWSPQTTLSRPDWRRHLSRIRRTKPQAPNTP
jgi:hypothetical protein